MDHHNLAGRVICHPDEVRMTIRSQEDLSEIKHQTYFVSSPWPTAAAETWNMMHESEMTPDQLDKLSRHPADADIWS